MKVIVSRYSFLFILSAFLLSIFLGLILLKMPGVLRDGSLSFFNALFLAVSSITSTGIAPISIHLLSDMGKGIIIFLMYIGSIGLLTFLLGIFFYFRLPSVSWYGIANEILEIITMQRLAFFFRIIFYFSGGVILVGSAFFYFYSMLSDFSVSFIDCLFVAVNFFCNVGFSLMNTLPYQLMNSTVWYCGAIIMMIAGSIGFLSIFEIIEYYRKHNCAQKYAFSLTFSLMIKMYFLTIAVFWLFYLVFCEDVLTLQSCLRSLFAAVSFRACGISPYLSLPNSIIFISALYGILGAGPLGTGGGIKTSIIGIIVYTARSFFKSDGNIIIENKKISWSTVAYAHIFLVYIILLALFLSIVIDLYYAHSIDFILVYADILGLVTGSGMLWTPFTDSTDNMIKVLIIVVMCMSKILTILFTFSLSKLKKPNCINYPEGKMIIM
jgi:trk system potassium uptake protein TrkH